MSEGLQCGPFDLLERIGHGSAGVVWKAVHRGSGIEVAVKLFHHAKSRSTFSLRNEVRAAARLEHPNIVMLFEQGRASADGLRGILEENLDTSYLAMEYCAGGALSEQRNRAPWPVLRSRLVAILEALAHAHSRGVIHRDLKPGNVLLSPTQGGGLCIKLSDFGIAHALEETVFQDERDIDPRQGRLSGTLYYMAPEQLAGQWRDEGPWTDLYAVGVIAYEATTGSSPWRATSRNELLAKLVQSAPPLRSRMPVPEGLQGWVDRLLAKSTNLRYQSAAAALEGLCALGEPTVWGRTTGSAVPIDDARPDVPHLLPQRELALQGIGLSLYGLRPTQMTGREEQRDTSWRDVTCAIHGGGPRVILLRGEMGVGTSKLAGWLAEHAHARHGALRIRASHSPIAGPADGLAAMLRRHLLVAGLDTEARARRAARLVSDDPLADDTELEAASLAALLAEPTGESSHAPTMAEQTRTVRRYLLRIAKRQPIVLTIDNAQWGHNALALCNSILDLNTGSLPLVFLVLVNDEALAGNGAAERDLHKLSEHPRASLHTLGPLSDLEHRELITNTLRLSPTLLDLVATRTKGDALFSTSLLRYWVQANSLMATDHGFEFRAPEADNTPMSLVSTWDAQLDVLSKQLANIEPEQLRQALQIAAALGTSVEDNEWRAACAQAGVQIPDGLVQGLSEINIVTPSRLGWHFRHEAFRDHLQRRAKHKGCWEDHHRHCAEALTKLTNSASARETARMQGRIGRHMHRGGLYVEACAPLLSGAIFAREASDWGESHRIFDLLDAAATAQDNARLSIESRIERVPCYVSQGQLGEASQRAESAFSDAQFLGDDELQARANMALAAIEIARSNTDTAADLLVAALDQLGPYDPLLRVGALTKLGSICMWRRELTRASHYFRQAQEIVGDDSAYRSERGHILRGMAHLAHCHEDFAGATRIMGEAMACFEKEGNKFATASCINDLGDLLRHQGRLAESETLYRDALALFESLQAVNAITVRCNLGYVLIERGRYDEAQGVFRELLSSALAQERQIDMVWILSGLLPCVAAARNWTEWDSLQERISAYAEQGLVDEDLASAYRLAAGLARRSGHFERAKWAYRSALDHYERMDKPTEVTSIRDLLADLG